MDPIDGGPGLVPQGEGSTPEARAGEGREVVINILNEEIPVGGRMTEFHHAWRFSKWASSIVKNGLD